MQTLSKGLELIPALQARSSRWDQPSERALEHSWCPSLGLVPPAFLPGCALAQLDAPLSPQDSSLGGKSQHCLDPRDLPLDVAELTLKASPLCLSPPWRSPSTPRRSQGWFGWSCPHPDPTRGFPCSSPSTAPGGTAAKHPTTQRKVENDVAAVCTCSIYIYSYFYLSILPRHESYRGAWKKLSGFPASRGAAAGMNPSSSAQNTPKAVLSPQQ